MTLNQKYRVKILSEFYGFLDGNKLNDVANPIMRFFDWGHPNSLLRVKFFLWRAIRSNGNYSRYGVQRKADINQLKTAYVELVRIAKKYETDL